MRTRLIFLLLALAPAAIAQTESGMDFALPAQFGGVVAAEGGQWVLVAFSPEATGVGELEALVPAGGIAYNLTNARHADMEWSPLIGHFGGVPEYTNKTIEVGSPITARLAIGPGGPGSVYLRADRIELRESGSVASLREKPPQGCLESWMDPSAGREHAPRIYEHCPAGWHGVVSLEPSAAFRLEAHGIRQIDWMQADVACAAACPPGGGVHRIDVALPPDGHVSDIYQTTIRVHAEGGRLSLEGHAVALFFGGPAPVLHVDGWGRFPRAAQEGALCPSACTVDADQTLAVEGSFRLDGLKPSEGGRMSAALGGSILSARLDETQVDPDGLFLATAVVAVAGGVAALSWLVKVMGAALYTKLTESKALEHKRRRLILDVVEEHAGCSFRELRRRTGIPSGTLRHHVTILVRNGVLVEHPHRSTVRFFPNDGSYTEIWRQVVQLREPEMMRLHGVVRKLGIVAQKGILDTAEIELGWSRSTTQHRLARLVADGAIHMRQQGRYKMYFAVVNERRKPGPGESLGFSAPAPEAGNTPAA